MEGIGCANSGRPKEGERSGAAYRSTGAQEESKRIWNAAHLANAVFRGIEGDIRVCGATVLVTFYNAPEPGLLRQHYEGLPQKLRAEGIDFRVPWLYGLMLDFSFR